MKAPKRPSPRAASLATYLLAAMFVLNALCVVVSFLFKEYPFALANFAICCCLGVLLIKERERRQAEELDEK